MASFLETKNTQYRARFVHIIAKSDRQRRNSPWIQQIEIITSTIKAEDNMLSDQITNKWDKKELAYLTYFVHDLSVDQVRTVA